MSPEHLARRLVERWVSTYTSGLDEQTAERRRAEIRADLHDHVAHGRRRGHHPWRIAGEVVFRSMRGAPADLAWRSARRDSTAGRRAAELIGGSVMNATVTAAKAIGLTGVVLVVLYLMAGWIFGPLGPPADLRAIAVWLAFGAAIVAVSRLLTPPVVIGAATLLTLIAGMNLLGSAMPVPDHIVPSYISASEYTWIAIAVLYANSLGRTSAGRDARQEREEQAATTS